MLCSYSQYKGIYIGWFGCAGSSGYPTLRIEKNDLKSVTLLEAKAKVRDIAISRERITLKDVLQEGIYKLSQTLAIYSVLFIFLFSPSKFFQRMFHKNRRCHMRNRSNFCRESCKK